MDLFYPNSEMHNSSKISCVSWNWFLKSCLASSDYEGNVVLWDTVTNKRTRVYQVSFSESLSRSQHGRVDGPQETP